MKGSTFLAKIEIGTREVVKGRLKKNEYKAARLFIRDHHSELLEAWKDCERGKHPKKIG